MATRFRLPSAGAAAVSPAFESYTHSGSEVQRPMPTTIVGDSSALSTVAITPDASDHLVAGDTIHWMGVSAPLAAQSIAAQTVTLVVQLLEANNNNNLFLQLVLKIVSNDGTTVLSTILSKTLDDLEMPSGLGSRTFGATTSAYTIASGDAGARLVAEISVSGTPAASGGVQGHNASIRWGSDGAGGDIPNAKTHPRGHAAEGRRAPLDRSCWAHWCANRPGASRLHHTSDRSQPSPLRRQRSQRPALLGPRRGGMSATRGKPIYLDGNDDRVLVYLDELDTTSPPNRKAATGLTGLTVRLAATPTGSAIDASLSKNLTELGTTGYYTAVFEGGDLDSHLDNASYRGKDIYQIVGDGANVNVVTVRKVIKTRGIG